MKKNVAVLGASNNPERYSYLAVKLLKEKGYNVLPISPKEKNILGISCISDLRGLIGNDIYTVTVYVNPQISSSLSQELLNLHPKRVVFNPGSENAKLSQTLKDEGIEVIEACTLVMLRANTFEDLK